MTTFTLRERINKYLLRGFKFKDHNFRKSDDNERLLILKEKLTPDDGTGYNNDLYVSVNENIISGCYQLCLQQPWSKLLQHLPKMKGYDRYPGHYGATEYRLKKLD